MQYDSRGNEFFQSLDNNCARRVHRARSIDHIIFLTIHAAIRSDGDHFECRRNEGKGNKFYIFHPANHFCGIFIRYCAPEISFTQNEQSQKGNSYMQVTTLMTFHEVKIHNHES